MEKNHKSALSKARSAHPMLVRARQRGIETLGELQTKLRGRRIKVSRPFLSMVMRRVKPCPERLRVAILALTGWKIGARKPRSDA